MSRDLLSISKRYYRDDGTRKPDHYFKVYEQYLSPLRDKPINILELGVSSGASVLTWNEYFPCANIVCLDISPKPDNLKLAIPITDNIKFVQGDQSAITSLRECMDQSTNGTFDVIIDDAAHVGALAKASFDFFFPLMPSGGLYFVEDFGTGYFPGFYDGEEYKSPSNADPTRFSSHESGMVGWLKQLVDVIHWPQINPTNDSIPPIESIFFWHSIALVTRK